MERKVLTAWIQLPPSGFLALPFVQLAIQFDTAVTYVNVAWSLGQESKNRSILSAKATFILPVSKPWWAYGVASAHDQYPYTDPEPFKYNLIGVSTPIATVQCREICELETMAFVIDPCPNCDFDLASIFDFRICSDELLEQISSTFGHCPSCGAYIVLDKSPDDFWKQYRERHPDEFLPMPDGYDDDDEDKDTDNGEASGENACFY